jgi:hypothetical protein
MKKLLKKIIHPMKWFKFEKKLPEYMSSTTLSDRVFSERAFDAAIRRQEEIRQNAILRLENLTDSRRISISPEPSQEEYYFVYPIPIIDQSSNDKKHESTSKTQ